MEHELAGLLLFQLFAGPLNEMPITPGVCAVQMGEQRLVWNDEMKLRLIKVQLLGQQNAKACHGMLSPAMVMQIQGPLP